MIKGKALEKYWHGLDFHYVSARELKIQNNSTELAGKTLEGSIRLFGLMTLAIFMRKNLS